MTDKEITLRQILPNAVTMTALAFGVSALNMAFWGQWKLAVLFILLAGVFDFLDGGVARLLNVTSRFGAELDSLSDFVSFGVAPGFLMYQWTMKADVRIEALQHMTNRADAIGIYWAIALFLAMCCATRLARFNALLDIKQPPEWTHFFMGVPAPAGAGLAVMPLILWFATGQSIPLFRSPYFVGFFLIFSGVMMVSKVPTLCLKHLHLKARYASVARIFALLLLAGLVANIWITISFVGIVYLIFMPLGIAYFLRQRKLVAAPRGRRAFK